MKGKNRLVPRLLGIDKESVLRVDEKTKDVSSILGILFVPSNKTTLIMTI